MKVTMYTIFWLPLKNTTMFNNCIKGNTNKCHHIINKHLVYKSYSNHHQNLTPKHCLSNPKTSLHTPIATYICLEGTHMRKKPWSKNQIFLPTITFHIKSHPNTCSPRQLDRVLNKNTFIIALIPISSNPSHALNFLKQNLHE